MKKWDMEDYKQLLEAALVAYDDPMNVPCTLDPFKEGVLYRKAKQQAITWCLEMLPEIKVNS